MKRMIGMAVVLVITMAAVAQKKEFVMNENISGKDNASSNEKEATPINKKPKAAFIFDMYGKIPATKPVFEAEHYLGSDITGKWNTFIQNYTHEYDVTIRFTDSSVEILKSSIYEAVDKVNKYYRKALKKGEVNREVVTFNMGYILNCANVMCFDNNNKSLEGALKSVGEPEEVIALFNQVILRKL